EQLQPVQPRLDNLLPVSARRQPELRDASFLQQMHRDISLFLSDLCALAQHSPLQQRGRPTFRPPVVERQLRETRASIGEPRGPAGAAGVRARPPLTLVASERFPLAPEAFGLAPWSP